MKIQKSRIILTILLLAIILLNVLQIGSFAVDSDIMIIKENDDKYLIYVNAITDESFSFAFSNTKEETDLHFIKSVTDNEGNNIAYIDNGLKNEVARFITDMGYNPIILHEQPNRGKTIIEKIEAFSKVCFAIILYTPCDKGASKDSHDLLPRARQNVVFEHGYLVGKLGRERVCALVKEEVEKPGDVDGVVYIMYDDRGAWKKDIAKEFNTLGLHFDANALLR